MDLELQKKYSEELQKLMKERNQLKKELSDRESKWAKWGAEKDKKIVDLKDEIAVLECENSNLKRKLHKEGGKLYMTSSGEEYISQELEQTIRNNTILQFIE